MTYTIMRTGNLVRAGGGSGLILSEIDTPTCDELPIDDAFRFIVEALTLETAAGRAFSLCTSSDASQFKEMRFAGQTRREEVEALLSGKIKEAPPQEPEDAPKSAEVEAAEAKAEAESEADREAEIARLFEQGRKRGIEAAERLKREEEEKARLRAERLAKIIPEGGYPDPEPVANETKPEQN